MIAKFCSTGFAALTTTRMAGVQNQRQKMHVVLDSHGVIELV